MTLVNFVNQSTGALYNKKTESLLRVLEYVISYRLPRELYLPSHKLTLTRVMVNGKDLLSKGRR